MKSLLSVLLLLIASVAGAESKVAIVDLQKVLLSTSEGKKARADLDTEVEKHKKDFQKKETELSRMEADLGKKKSVLTESAFKKKKDEFQQEMVKYRDEIGKSQEQLDKKQRELLAPIMDKLNGVIAKVAKTKGVSIVYQSNPTVIYAEPGSDMTADVIAAYEAAK